ncbi:MAG: glycosyltransferase family 4 protein [Lachnospiraceae bacterium]|nr:glycosyltransferase family 4 protein [Lachnospiraceae bacterium]
MKQKVAIDLTALGERMSGLERYAYRITKELLRQVPDTQFILVVRNRVPQFLRGWKKYANARFCVVHGENKLVTNQLRLPAVMYRIHADRYLFPAFPVPLLFKHPQTYGLIADTACFDCPETMKQRAVAFFGAGLLHTAAVCRKVITISEFSRIRIEKRLGVEAERIIYAPCAAEIAQMPTEQEKLELRRRAGLPEQYWLCLCTLEPRKNLTLLLRAYRELLEEGVRMPALVLAGRDGWKNRKLYREVRRIAPEQLYLLGEVEEKDLAPLYAGADCFLFPSRYEGFGMPPLEAQSYGVRKVVVSDAGALRETMGRTAFYFKNRDLRSLKQALMQASVWKGCSSIAMEKNLQRFSWKRSARLLWEGMECS